MSKSLLALFFGILLLSPFTLSAQDVTSNTFGKGIKIKAEDESFELKFSTRFQTLYAGVLDLDTDEYTDQLLTRRARLKFEGFVYSPKVEYKVELGLTNRDTRNSSGGGVRQFSGTSNIILDAVVKYKFAPGWELWFGQTKLPGNRERVISSQKLQFVDRSLVNSRFNIDRDTGVQLKHKGEIGNAIFKKAVSISIGEGRNVTTDNPGGYSYTGRVEVLPFGDFTSKGDYFGSDLKREEKGKLSIGATLSYNDGAVRSGGQLGGFVTNLAGDLVRNNLTIVFLDAIYKYNGFSFASEYANTNGDNAIGGFRTGSGFVAQAGYLLDSNFEPAFRFTTINAGAISALRDQNEYTFGLSRYIVGHSLKVQSDVSYIDTNGASNELRFRFQVELSF